MSQHHGLLASCCLHPDLQRAAAAQAGKSTYLKQVGLLVVLAQCGAYVPAEAMALRPLDAIFTRMGTGDSIETNASTFMVEMQVCRELTAFVSRRS